MLGHEEVLPATEASGTQMNEILFRQLFRVTLSLVYDVAYGQFDLDQVSMVFGLMLSRQHV